MTVKRLTLVAALAAGLLLAVPADGAPIINQFKVSGVAQTLTSQTGGHLGGLNATNRMGYNTDTDRIHIVETASSGLSFFWLDPNAYGDVGGAHDSKTGVARHWDANRDFYAGTVTGDTKVALGSGGHGFAYVPETGSMFAKSSSGNGTTLHEYQAARTDGGSDVVGEGTTGDQTNSGRLLTSGGPLTTGEFHTGLAYLGNDGDSHNFLTIDSQGGTGQHGAFFSLAAPRTTEPTATTAGTRDFSDLVESGGDVIASSVLNGLVPGVSDAIVDLANDLSGTIWALSIDGDDTYLTAFTLSDINAPATLTQVDLDPDSANLHVLLDGITEADGTTATNGLGLAVNGDASRIYVNADGGSGKDQVFIYTNSAPVPEPATLALLALGGLGLAGTATRRGRKT